MEQFPPNLRKRRNTCYQHVTRHIFIIVATIIICLQLTMAIVHADGFGSRYMVRTGLYPADTQYDRGYRIPTYLPYGTLFFVVKPEIVHTDNDWIQVISQFGQKYFIGADNLKFSKNNEIYSRTIENLYGDQDYIFHGNKSVCSVALEIENKYADCDSDASIEIVRGDVAEAVQASSNEIVELKLHGKVDGNVFLKKVDFDVLIEKGLVTDLKNSYPRFLRIDRIKVGSSSVKCGDSKTKISYTETETAFGMKANVGLSGGISLINFFKSIFSFELSANESVKTGDKIELETTLGGIDHGVDTYVLIVNDLRQGKVRQFDIYAKTKCVASSRKKPNIYLERLEVYENGDSVSLVEIEFSELYSWQAQKSLTTSDPPYKVWELNNHRPYLTSINSREDYWNIHAAFLKDTKDADLASLLISEFNASCIRTKTLGEEPYRRCRELLPAKAYNQNALVITD